MHTRFTFLFFILLIGGCQPTTEKQVAPETFLPAQPRAVLKIHDAEQFRSEFRNNALLKTFRDAGASSDLMQVLDEVLSLDLQDGSLLAFTALDSAESAVRSWLLLVPETRSVLADSLRSRAEDSIASPWLLADSTELFVAKRQGVLLVTPKSAVLQSRSFESEPPNEALSRALQTTNERSSASLLLPSDAEHPLARMLLQPLPDPPKTSTRAWSAYDLQLRSDALLLQGIEIRPDSLWDNRKVLRGAPVLPLEESLDIVPSDARALFSFSLRDPRRFLQNQQALLARDNTHQQLVESTEHLSILESSDAQLLILNCLNPEAVYEAFRPYTEETQTFQGRDIILLSENSLLREAFSPLVDRMPAMRYLTRIEPFIVFSENLEGIQNLISSHTRGDTFAKSSRYNQLQTFMASESSALALALDPARSNYLSDSLAVLGLPGAIRDKLPESYLYAGQLNSEANYDLLEYQFRQEADPTGSGRSVDLVFTEKLQGQVTAGPFFVKNHNSGHLDIAVQDDRDQLYLFSDRGELFWKKELPGPIQGKIHQVDLFKNGKWQMAFTTPDQLLVLDRNGQAVSPFPKAFPGGNLGPLALFDYDDNRNYRLVFSQGSTVHMYDGQGRVVKGFKFTDAGSQVLQAPEHIRIGTRDYLIFRLEDGRLRILNRVGNTRVRVDDRFEFSGNGVFLYRNTFAFTDAEGRLVTINPSGRIGRTPLNLNPDHGMYATAKTLALMNDNQLRVKGNTAELDLGVYTRPLIFYLYDIIYVAVTDIQSQRLYLFRSDASQVSGFPVEANSLPDMADTDGDRSPELAVRFRDSAIALYRLQR